MKRGKRLTRDQKEYVLSNHLNADDWLFVADLGAYIKIVSKTNKNKTKIITKERK